VEPIRNLFVALFLSIVKTAVVVIVMKAFGYSLKTSFIVGISLAQIGEFAFVLPSRASNLHLVE
ncbi:K(+) efflux antiporter 5, partial [Mucuna pruriens]